jgi:transcriptional regulator with XRE-family HTH domain
VDRAETVGEVDRDDAHFGRPSGGHGPLDEGRDVATSLQAVGDQVRLLRTEARLSLRDLAAAAALSSSFLSMVERGECSLSLTSLFAIANALGVDPGDILRSGSAHARPPAPYALWRGADHAGAHTVVGEREYFPFSPGLTDEELHPLLFRIRPTSTIAPLATHVGEEVAYVLSGTLYVRLAGEELYLDTGHGIHFSSAIPHAIANRTDEVVEALWITGGGSHRPDPTTPPS